MRVALVNWRDSMSSQSELFVSADKESSDAKPRGFTYQENLVSKEEDRMLREA